jgi:hypothetical protein
MPEMDDDVLEAMGLEEPSGTGMSEEEYQGAVKAAITDAADYIDDEVAPAASSSPTVCAPPIFTKSSIGKASMA